MKRFTRKGAEKVLENFMRMGFLEKYVKNSEVAYRDSKLVRKLLKEGKSRGEIISILKRSSCKVNYG